MTKVGDWVRITLRLPPRLHATLTKAAAVHETSLNNEIIDLLHTGLAGDFETGVASLPPSEWMQELRRVRAANERRYEALERAINETLAPDAERQTKKGAA